MSTITEVISTTEQRQRELDRTRNGAKILERTLEAAKAEIDRLREDYADRQDRIKALEDLVKSILIDLSQRAQLTDEPELIDLSNGLILRAAALLEKK